MNSNLCKLFELVSGTRNLSPEKKEPVIRFFHLASNDDDELDFLALSSPQQPRRRTTMPTMARIRKKMTREKTQIRVI